MSFYHRIPEKIDGTCKYTSAKSVGGKRKRPCCSLHLSLLAKFTTQPAIRWETETMFWGIFEET